MPTAAQLGGGHDANRPHHVGRSTVTPSVPGGALPKVPPHGLGPVTPAGNSYAPQTPLVFFRGTTSGGGGPAPHVSTGQHPAVAQPPTVAQGGGAVAGLPPMLVGDGGRQQLPPMPAGNTYAAAAGIADQPGRAGGRYVAPKQYGY